VPSESRYRLDQASVSGAAKELQRVESLFFVGAGQYLMKNEQTVLISHVGRDRGDIDISPRE
jgi:hypothetical protein